MGEKRWSGGEGVYLESTLISPPSPPIPLLGFSDARLPGAPTGSSDREWICGGPRCCHSLQGGEIGRLCVCVGGSGFERKGCKRKWATQPGGEVIITTFIIILVIVVIYCAPTFQGAITLCASHWFRRSLLKVPASKEGPHCG